MALQNLAQKSVTRKRTTYPQILEYANEDKENTGVCGRNNCSWQHYNTG